MKIRNGITGNSQNTGPDLQTSENVGEGRFAFPNARWRHFEQATLSFGALPPIARRNFTIGASSEFDGMPILKWVFSKQPGQNVPYADFKPEDVPAATAALIAILEKNLADYETQLKKLGRRASWSEVRDPYVAIVRAADRFFSLVDFLAQIQSKTWGDVSIAAVNTIKIFYARLAQSQIISMAFERFSKRADAEQSREIRAVLTAARLQGSNLDTESKRQNDELQRALTIAKQKFDTNLNATYEEVTVVFTKRDEVEGFSEALRTTAAENFKAVHPDQEANADTGPWLLKATDLKLAADTAANPNSQERIFAARLKLGANPDSGHDNASVVEEIVDLRHRIAAVQGYTSYAEYAWSDDVLTTRAEVDAFLNVFSDSLERTSIAAYDRLQALAAEQGVAFSSASASYLRMQLRKSINYRVQEIEQKLVLDDGLRILFAKIESVYGLKIQRQPNPPAGLPEGVFRCDVYRDGQYCGQIDFDLLGRDDKKKTAIHFMVVSHEVLPDGTSVLPYSYLSANYSRKNAEGQIILGVKELEQLCHEMGHALQGLLYNRDSLLTAGVNNMESDAVEIGSMFSGLFLGDLVMNEILKDTPDLLANYKENRQRESQSYYAFQVMLGRFDASLNADPGIDTFEEIDALYDRICGEFRPFVGEMPNLDDVRAYPTLFSADIAGAYHAYVESQTVALNYLNFVNSLFAQGKTEREVGEAIAHLYNYGGAADPRTVYRTVTGNLAYNDPTAMIRWLGLEPVTPVEPQAK